MPISSEQFLRVVRPLLVDACPDRLAAEVTRHWEPKQICQLLGEPDADVRRLAAVTLGLVGGCCVVGCLVRALHDEDEQVNQLAEDALWSIWFRSGKCAATQRLHSGMAMIEAERYDQAVAELDLAQQIDPDFAEAYNQSAIAHFLAERWDQAVEHSKRAIKLMPSHFGAISGLGHCYTHQHKLAPALDCYERALQINPNMPGIRDAVAKLRETLGREPGGPGGAEASGGPGDDESEPLIQSRRGLG